MLASSLPPGHKAAITHEGIVRAQHSNPFCKEMASHLKKGEGVAKIRLSKFFTNKAGFLCRKAHPDGFERIVKLTTLR